MQLIFIYGQAAAGKLTVARELVKLTGLPLFHNHLVVDALAAVFEFGAEPFVRLREDFWLKVFEEAARLDRSLIFTFAPEATVAPDFPEQVRSMVENHGGTVLFVALEISPDEQERRIADAGRAEFGKLRSVEVLRSLRENFDRCMAQMPAAHLTIDTDSTDPADAAAEIARRIAT